jgi:hopene-associated glycosyltransferase HpnB
LLGLLSLCIWVYLIFAHGRYWLSRPELAAAVPTAAPAVDIIVPARDEAETIGPVVASLLAQQYAGRLRVIVVDDGSSDGTADLARAVAREETAATLQVVPGRSKPPGWSGKLWAVSQGVDVSDAPLMFLTDADIRHDPRHLATLVARLEERQLDLVSEMVRLNCQSPAECWLVPAFVYFFQMLYPFARVNDPRSRTAAAAGGTVLIRREALARIGGIASIRGALIDDVTLAKSVKRGGAVYLGHSGLATSIRRYPRAADIWQMIARTAFTQLHHSAVLVVLTVLGLALVWWVPVAEALFGHGVSRLCGLAAVCLSVVSYWPTLMRYRCSLAWSLTLPFIALFYLTATVGSAVSHWRGAGARWKSRDYGGG